MSGRADRKRQARLSFTPLPSSSPAAKDYNKQVQQRAAAVTVDSPAKRRKIASSGLASSQLDGANAGLPTPIASFPTRVRALAQESEDDESSEPVRSTQRRSQRKSQQQLDFSGARDADTFSSPLKLSSSRTQRSPAGPGIFGSRSQKTIDISSDGSEDSDEELPSPGKLVSKRKADISGKNTVRATRSSQKAITVDSESEDNTAVNSGQVEEIDGSEEDDDDMPTTSGTQRRKKPAQRRSSFISPSPPNMVESESDDVVEVTSSRRRRHKESDDSASDEPVTPRRKLSRPKQMSKRDQDDLDEDLDFLGPSSDIENSARKSRNTQTAQKTAKQLALEKLKRKRSGHEEQAEQQQQPAIVVEDDDDDDEDEVDDSDSETDQHQDDQHKPMSSAQMFRPDEHDEDFIENDDDNLGAPDNLPIEYSRYASMKPKELFKYAVEWMVQKKINPAFQMDDPIYGLTFKKLDDEVQGMAGSKFKSAAWTLPFTMSLNARPDIAYDHLDREDKMYMLDHCAACNRSNHPASYRVQFQGKPYHRESLEEVGENDEDDEDDSSETDDDQPSWDAEGREIPPASKVYYVGKFCMGNAQTAHALQHWRYHLNEWVVTWLERHGYTSAQKIVERDKWKIKKRQKDANKIVDRMEEQGVVKQLYRDFKQSIDDARNSKEVKYRGGSP